MKAKIKKLPGLAMLLLMACFVSSAKAQNQDDPISKNLGLGFQINQYQNDFGLGLQLTSPYFIKKRVAVRARGNVMFLEHLEDGLITWTPYSNFTLGFIGSGATIGNFMHLYGEGGVIFIQPSGDFSSQAMEIGGYGLFGFEFYFFPHGNYFIEIGGAGTGAQADKVPTEPIYSNGLLISTGIRFIL